MLSRVEDIGGGAVQGSVAQGSVVQDGTAPFAIRFIDVCKQYRLYNDDKGRILDGITGFKVDRLVKKIKHANDHVSFDIRRGESVAFLGRNGAGKSTAMKLIAGVTFPDSGIIEVNGRVSALIEVNKGLVKDLTGRENLIVRGLTLGMDPDEINAVLDDVVEFAELGDYIDQPLRTYSSGMKSRLGFAFATTIEPDILVVDEALSVGDAKFREKCVRLISDIMVDDQVTVCLVTHSTPTAKDICTRGIVFDSGRIVFDGPIDEAVERYEAL